MLCMLRMCGVYAACAVHAVYGTLFGVFFVYYRRETIELSIELELEEILLPGGKTTSRPPRGCGRRLRTPRVELGVAEGARGRFCRQGRAGSLFHRQGRHSGEVHRMRGGGGGGGGPGLGYRGVQTACRNLPAPFGRGPRAVGPQPTIQYNTTQYSTIQYTTIQYNTKQYNRPWTIDHGP